MAFALEHGILRSDPDGNLLPADPATRIVLASALLHAAAVTPPVVEGTVIDADTLAPIEGLNVLLAAPDFSCFRIGTTDAEGNYAIDISGIADGGYIMRTYSFRGYIDEWLGGLPVWATDIYGAGTTLLDWQGASSSGADFSLDSASCSPVRWPTYTATRSPDSS